MQADFTDALSKGFGFMQWPTCAELAHNGRLPKIE